MGRVELENTEHFAASIHSRQANKECRNTYDQLSVNPSQPARILLGLLDWYTQMVIAKLQKLFLSLQCSDSWFRRLPRPRLGDETSILDQIQRGTAEWGMTHFSFFNLLGLRALTLVSPKCVSNVNLPNTIIEFSLTLVDISAIQWSCAIHKQ